MKRTVTVYTDVEVEVDISKFNTITLLDELKERRARGESIDGRVPHFNNDPDDAEEMVRAVPPLNGAEHHPIHSIYYAMKFGKQEHALDLMRDYVSDQLGVVL